MSTRCRFSRRPRALPRLRGPGQRITATPVDGLAVARRTALPSLVARRSVSHRQMRSTSTRLHWFTQIGRSRLFLLVRMVVVLTALQLSGAVHAAVDLYSAFASAVVDADCDEERAGNQCPAGCPNCHCVARTIVTPPRLINVEALLTVRASERMAVTVNVLGCLQGPSQTSLYRPPRA